MRDLVAGRTLIAAACGMWRWRVQPLHAFKALVKVRCSRRSASLREVPPPHNFRWAMLSSSASTTNQSSETSVRREWVRKKGTLGM